MKYEPSWCGIFHLWHWVTLQGLNFEAFLIWGFWTRVTPLVLKGYPDVMADFSIFFPPNLPMWAALVISLGPALSLPQPWLNQYSSYRCLSWRTYLFPGYPWAYPPATTIPAIHPFTHHPKLLSPLPPILPSFPILPTHLPHAHLLPSFPAVPSGRASYRR